MRFENIEFLWLIPIAFLCALFISLIAAPRHNLWISNVELIRENFKSNWRVRLRWLPSFFHVTVVFLLIVALISQPMDGGEIDDYVSHPGNIPDFRPFPFLFLEPFVSI